MILRRTRQQTILGTRKMLECLQNKEMAAVIELLLVYGHEVLLLDLTFHCDAFTRR